MNTTPFRSATELAGLIKAKKISSEDMLDLYFARVGKHKRAHHTPPLTPGT
jgi:hypothetical protein